MNGFDFLGAVTLSPSKTKAVTSGKRAIAAGQKIAKTAPRLSAAIVKAGQKALATAGTPAPSAGASQAQQSSSLSSTNAAQDKPSTQRQRLSTQMKPVKNDKDRKAQEKLRSLNQAYFHPKTTKQSKKTHVGEEETSAEGTDQQADIYSQLSDVASKVADFMAYFQGLIDQIPPNLPIVQNGLGVISQLQNWFANPLEAALSGDSQALTKTQDINDVVQNLIDQQNNIDKHWPWDWAALAEAYVKMHPAAQPATDATAAQSTPTATTPTSASSVSIPVMPPQTAAMPSAPMAAPTQSAPPSMGTPPQQASPDDGGDGYYEEEEGGGEEDSEYSNEEGGDGEDMYSDSNDNDGDSQYDDTEIGKGGGGHGGGHGGHGHGHHHGGDRGHRGGWGGGWWGGPWGGWPVYEGVEIDDELTQHDIDNITDDLAQKVAKHLKKGEKATVGEAFDLLGDESIGESWLDIHLPGDYKNAARQLKVSADNVNLTAAMLPAWKGIYENANRIYEQYKDVGWSNALSLSQTTWEQIADAQRRIDEFANYLRSQGHQVMEPEHTPIDTSLTGGAVDWTKKNWPWLVGGGVALVAIPTVLPSIFAASMAVRGRK